MKTLTIAELQERLSNAVLAALDNEVKALLDHQGARGWTDNELPMLFRGLYPHIHAVASRINEGGEPGAAFFMIDVGGGETQAPFAQSVSTTAPATDKQDAILPDTLLLVAEAVRDAAIATIPGGSIVDPQLVADEIRGINVSAIIRKFQPAPEAPQQAFRVKTSGVGTPDVDVGVEVGDLLHHDHGPNLAEALARLALRVAKFHNLNAPTLTAFAVPTVTAQALPRDLLMEFGAAVRDAAKRADFDIGEDVDIAAIADRYASQVKPEPVLDKPASVGGLRFHAGLPVRYVIEAAQRRYEREESPEGKAERKANADKLLANTRPPEPVNPLLLAALEPFAKAHETWNGGDAPLHFSTAAVPAHFARAAYVYRTAIAAAKSEPELRDVLMAFANEVLEWNLESNWGSGASVTLDVIVDRYASQVKPQLVNQQLLTALEGVTLTQEQIDMGTTSSDEQHAVARAAIASVKGGV